MSQTWESDTYGSGHTGQTDLQNIEENFATLKSSFSGSGAPADPVAGMTWYDTTRTLLKYRNSSNAAWRGVLAGSSSLKLWLYLNAAEEGWAIDSSVTDRVLALKGGSQAYNVAGATQAGTWDNSTGLAGGAHTHGAGTLSGGSHTHNMGNHTHALDQAVQEHADGIVRWGAPTAGKTGGPNTDTTGGTSVGISGNTASGGTAPSSDSSYRPYAAVGTLQYCNV